ncbi:uncharacterized protein LOC134179620 [Corticium candelabrum]|uniref:uncharacterized protein LOC134179620 n=1 Tax=Corticium candelabrum TaxID=121492 RepID=UPI002E2566A5|nr:uncharacterized protein LOC134179620 [Corticium candelabrum]
MACLLLLEKGVNIEIICKSVPDNVPCHLKKTKELAEGVKETFSQLLSKFAACHNLYSVSRKLEEHEIDQLEYDIRDFLKHYREDLTNPPVTPKIHMLEEHVVPWIRRWKLGLGFHGEQGAESIHARFNALQRT